MKPNFELVTELQVLIRRDFPLASEGLLNPISSNPLLDGEWLELDANYKLTRGTGVGVNPAFPVHTERGRYDTQAIGKVNVLYLGEFEADTAIFDGTGLTMGAPLMVTDVTVGGLTKRGLKVADVTAGRVIVGFVTKLPTANGGKLRFIRTGLVKMA